METSRDGDACTYRVCLLTPNSHGDTFVRKRDIFDKNQWFQLGFSSKINDSGPIFVAKIHQNHDNSKKYKKIKI